MQFSDTSGKTGLVEDVTFLTGADANAYSMADRTRNMNRWYYKAVIEAWKAGDTWKFDDTNATGYPVAVTTMVDSQNDYSLPSTALKIQRVEVKDSNGDWSVVDPISQEEIDGALDEYYEIDGVPIRYRMVKNSVWLYPAPAASKVTLTSGLKIYFLREVDEFTAADTTQEPGIAEPFHRVISLGGAYDYCLAKKPDYADRMRNELERLLADLRAFYATRFENQKTKITHKQERYD